MVEAVRGVLGLLDVVAGHGVGDFGVGVGCVDFDIQLAARDFEAFLVGEGNFHQLHFIFAYRQDRVESPRVGCRLGKMRSGLTHVHLKSSSSVNLVRSIDSLFPLEFTCKDLRAQVMKVRECD